MLRVSFQGRNTHRDELWTSFIQGGECCWQGMERDWFIPCPAAGIAGKGAEDWKDKVSSCSGTWGGATLSSGFKQVERAKFSFMTCCKPRIRQKGGLFQEQNSNSLKLPWEFQCMRSLPQGQGTGAVTGGDFGPKCSWEERLCWMLPAQRGPAGPCAAPPLCSLPLPRGHLGSSAHSRESCTTQSPLRGLREPELGCVFCPSPPSSSSLTFPRSP